MFIHIMCVSVTFPSNLLFKLSLLHKKTFGIQQLNRYLSVKRLKYCQKRKPCLCYNVIKHCSKRSTHVFWRQPLPAALPIVGNDKWLLGLGWSRLHVTSEFDPISDEVTLTCLHTMSPPRSWPLTWPCSSGHCFYSLRVTWPCGEMHGGKEWIFLAVVVVVRW